MTHLPPKADPTKFIDVPFSEIEKRYISKRIAPFAAKDWGFTPSGLIGEMVFKDILENYWMADKGNSPAEIQIRALMMKNEILEMIGDAIPASVFWREKK